MAILLLSVGTVLVLSVLTPGNSTVQNRTTTEKGNNLREGISRYKANHIVLATKPGNLDALITDDALAIGACAFQNNTGVPTTYLTLQGWCGPYVDLPFAEDPNSFKTDGWGTAFSYTTATDVLKSCGPNRACGDADDITFP